MPKLRAAIPAEVRTELGQMAERLRQTRTTPQTEAGKAEERVAIFIDGENLIPRFGAKSGFRLHFNKLRAFLAAGRRVNLARWFDSFKDEAERTRKARLYLALHLSGFTVRSLPLKNGYKLKSRIDPYLQAEISERLLREERGEEPYTHTFILASGDSDFYPIVELLKRHGRRVEVAYLGNTLSHELRTAADRLLNLGEYLEELTFAGPSPGRSSGWGRKPRPRPRPPLPPERPTVSARPHPSPSAAIPVAPGRRMRLWRALRKLFERLLK